MREKRRRVRAGRRRLQNAPGEAPTPNDWRRLRRVQPERFDFEGLREEALRRMTVPTAALILGATFLVGGVLSLIGLDVAALVGGNAFDLFVVEAAYNGIAILIISFPLLLVSLGGGRVREAREEVVAWLTRDERERARAYLREVEGPDGLLWRFGASGVAVGEGHTRWGEGGTALEHALAAEAASGVGAEAGRALAEASRRGATKEIDLARYGKAVRALQAYARTRGASAWAREEHGGAEDEPGRRGAT